jgi:hypothetical protein
MLGSADYTASNGTTVVLATGATAGDLITTESFYVSSVLNAIPATAGAVTNAYLQSGAVTAAKMGANGTWAPTGTVVQVVSSTTITMVSTNNTSWTTTGHSVSITPKFSNSQILVMNTAKCYTAISGGQGGAFTLYRNSTNLSGGAGVEMSGLRVNGSVSDLVSQCAITYLDSPATTSATTYTIYMQSENGATVSYCSSAGALSTNGFGSLVAMEIIG